MTYASLSPKELVQACIDGQDASAWEEFIRRFHQLIATVALRTARRWGEVSPAAVQDLVQDTYLKLCANDSRLLRSFDWSTPEAFWGYLKVVTANVVHDYFKSLHSQKRGGGERAADLETTETVATAAGTGPGTADGIERDILLKQIDNCLRRAGGKTQERDRTIFWLHYRQGLTANAIAGLPAIGLTVKGVESTLLRLTRLVRSELVAAGGEPSGGEGIPTANSF